MTLFYKTILISIPLFLTACFATNSHTQCIEQEPYMAAIPYCCLYKSGYCQKTCYNYETRYRCLEAECEHGYVWQDVPDPQWFENDRQCVAE